MPTGEINGTDLVIAIDPSSSGTYKVVGCLKSQALTGSISELDASSKCNPQGKFIPGSKYDQTITGELLAIDQDGLNTINSYTQMYSLFSQGISFPVKYGKLVPTNGDAVYAATAFIKDMEIAAPFDELVTFNITLRISNGVATQTVTY